MPANLDTCWGRWFFDALTATLKIAVDEDYNYEIPVTFMTREDIDIWKFQISDKLWGTPSVVADLEDALTDIKSNLTFYQELHRRQQQDYEENGPRGPERDEDDEHNYDSEE